MLTSVLVPALASVVVSEVSAETFSTYDFVNNWLYANIPHYCDGFTGVPAAAGTVSITVSVARGDLRQGRGGLSLDLGPGYSGCGNCSEYYSGLLEGAGQGLYCGTGPVASTTVTVSASAWNTLRDGGVAGRVDVRVRSTL